MVAPLIELLVRYPLTVVLTSEPVEPSKMPTRAPSREALVNTC